MNIKVDLMLEYTCNSNCIFCYATEKRLKYNNPLSTKQAMKELKEARERGANIAAFEGGEPTIRKDLRLLIEYARKIGFKQISITTNGQMLSIEKFAKSLIDAGLTHMVISVHGHTPELHDLHTRVKGSFERIRKGIANMRKFGIRYIGSNTVITRYNYMCLPEIVDFLARKEDGLGVDSIELIFPHPEGGAKWHFDEIVPTLTELKPYVIPSIKQGLKHGIKHTYFRYLPLCYLGEEYIEFASEIVEKNFMREQHVGPEFKDLEVEKGREIVGKTKGPQCKKCKLNNICEGIWKYYAEKRGTDELVPVL